MLPLWKDERSMTLDELKQEAAIKANEIEIQWERMSDPKTAKDFENALEVGTILIPDMESLYLKLTSGKSVVFEDSESPLPYDDQEKYTALVEDALFEAYVIQEVLHKFRCITNILDLANPLDKDPNAD